MKLIRVPFIRSIPNGKKNSSVRFNLKEMTLPLEWETNVWESNKLLFMHPYDWFELNQAKTFICSNQVENSNQIFIFCRFVVLCGRFDSNGIYLSNIFSNWIWIVFDSNFMWLLPMAYENDENGKRNHFFFLFIESIYLRNDAIANRKEFSEAKWWWK